MTLAMLVILGVFLDYQAAKRMKAHGRANTYEAVSCPCNVVACAVLLTMTTSPFLVGVLTAYALTQVFGAFVAFRNLARGVS